MTPTVHRTRDRRTAGRAQSEPVADPYQARKKPREATVCRQCGAHYHKSRWQWAPIPADAHEDLCPACRRSNDGLPAGIVTLRGVPRERRDEVLALVRHQEEAEKREHPLNRIINVDETPDAIVIKTTDIHLPRRLGSAIERALHGELDVDFDEAAYLVRIDWRPPR